MQKRWFALLFSNMGHPVSKTLADEKDDNFIKIRNPKKLPAKNAHD